MRRSRKISSRVAKSMWTGISGSSEGPRVAVPAAAINVSLVLSQSSHTPSQSHFSKFGMASFHKYKI